MDPFAVMEKGHYLLNDGPGGEVLQLAEQLSTQRGITISTATAQRNFK
jgi:hypothetical protein